MPNPVTFKIKILVDGRERVVEATTDVATFAVSRQSMRWR